MKKEPFAGEANGSFVMRSDPGKGFERCEIVRIVFSDTLVVAADKENVIAKFADDF